jgi:hypothetical protein
MKPAIIACAITMLLSVVVHAHKQIPCETRILKYFRSVVDETKDHGLSGPIAFEAAQFALLRRIHEDGLSRDTAVSMNGMVPGSPNKEVITRLDLDGCELSHTTANDGQGCYVINGPRANIFGAVAIALWYDEIINSDRFHICNKREKEIWNTSKHHSHMIAIGKKAPIHRNYMRAFRKERIQILEKVNRAYGPQGKHINALRKKLEPFFSLAVM